MSAVAWAVAGFIAVALAALPVSGGLIADWQFEGNVDDATGTYDATALNSPTYATGVIGRAISLNGSNQAATVPGMGTYANATISAWVNTRDANSPLNQAIFHNSNYANGTPHFLLESFATPDPSITGLVIDVPTAGAVKINGGNSSISEGTWYHVAYTYDKPGQQLQLFINGALQGTTGSASMVDLVLNNMMIGAANAAGTDRPFNGLIDDLGVWDETLTDTQVLGISNFATSSLNYGQSDVAALYGLGSGQSTSTSDGATWEYATGLSGTLGTVESLGSGLYAMNLGGGTGVQMTAAAPVPEPSTIALLAAGGAGFAGAAARRRRAQVGRRSHQA